MRKIALAVLVASAIAVPATVLAPVAQASGTCTSTISVANVYVHSTMTAKVPGTWTTKCTAIFASWNMQGGPGYGHYAGSWNFSSGTINQDSYYDPEIDPLGKYQASPAGAQDSDGDDVAQGTVYFEIRLSSKVTISGYRAGHYVFVRADVTRFSTSVHSGQGGWVSWTDQPVTFTSWANGWQSAGTRWSTSTGLTKYLKIYAPTRRSFRAAVSTGSTIWGSMSKAFRS